MSVAYYVVLDVEEPRFDPWVNGKAVAHAVEELDALCQQSGLQTLDSFLGQAMEDIADMLDEDIELPDGDDGLAKWFEPAEGIALIESIVSVIQQNPTSLSSSAEVLEDLAEYQTVLEKARGIKARWHFALDF